MPSVVLLLGEIGSGKTEVARQFETRYGYENINSGRVLASLMNVPAVPRTERSVFQNHASRYLSTAEGVTEYVERLAEISAGGDRILIDGIRYREVLVEIIRRIGRRHVATLFVHTPPDLALEWYRDRENSAASAQDFYSLRSAASEREVSSLISVSDCVIYNWRGIDELGNVVDKLGARLEGTQG